MAPDQRKPRQEVEKAFVLGAGFSKPFGFPLLHDLLSKVLQYADSNAAPPFWKELKGTLTQFIKDVFPLCSSIPGHDPDIVEVVDMLQALHGLKGVFANSVFEFDPKTLLSSFRKALAVVFQRKLAAAERRKRIGGSFFQNVEPGTVFVSLNWDNVLERGLYNAGKRFGFKYNKKEAERILVIKPHGSMDWFRRFSDEKRFGDLYSPLSAPVHHSESRPGKHTYLKERVRIARIRSIEEPVTALEVLLKHLPEPALVAIGHGKTHSISSLDKRIDGMWKQAGSILPRAKQIFIVGYSLPNDEVEVRLLLAHSIWRHKIDYGEFPSVTVVNPDASTYCRFAEAIGPELNFDLHRFTPDTRL